MRGENDSAAQENGRDERVFPRDNAAASDVFTSDGALARPVMGEMAENDGFTGRIAAGEAAEMPPETDTEDQNTGVRGIAEGLGRRRFDAEDLILVSLLMALLGEDGDGMTPLLLALLLV